MSDTGPRVGVLSLHNSKETKAILNALDELGADPVWLRRENVAVGIHDGDVRLEPDVDAVVNRLLLSNTTHPEELLGLARCLSTLRPTLNRPDEVLGALHKYATATALAEAGIRVPDALLALDAGRLNEERPDFGPEAVFKTAIGTHGGGTWKVGADEQVNPMVGDRFAFLQSLVERDDVGEGGERHRDLRVYVVGGEVVASMYRYAPDTDWRTNVALGGSVEGVSDLPDEAREFALDAAATLGLDYAGVDLVEGAAGWHVLEVNPTAGFKGLFEATGVSPAPHIARLGIETAGGTVSDAAVADLADTFDFSRPRQMPERVSGATGERRAIGYTEEVLVSGTSGSEQVVAKSDTGAGRTSIDTQLAARIGAGPIRSMTTVKSGSAPSGTSRPVVDIVVGVGGDRHTVAASLTDRSNLRYPLLLGRDILGNYQVDVGRRHDDGDGPESEE
jgi:RimK family alpha-L-glutamate ligase